MGDRNVAQWLAAFVPAAVTVSRREIALGAPGALLGLGSAAWLSHHLLGGPAVHALGYAFVLWPVAIDSLLLLMAALVFNVSARRRYPHRAHAPAPTHLTRDVPPSARVGLTLQDLHAAIEARGELLDV